MLLLKHLLCFDEAFQTREGTLCFVWSRMRVVDEKSAHGKARLTQLAFEDMLEGFVRVATMKALPTDAEVAEAGKPDAGEFLIHLRAQPAVYDAFLEARDASSRWNAPPNNQPM